MTSIHDIALIPRDLIIDALIEAACSADNIHEDYSGRGMFGRTCFGVTFDNLGELTQFAYQLGLAADEWDEPIADAVERMVGRTVTDSMGLGIIAYWPGFTVSAS